MADVPANIRPPRLVEELELVNEIVIISCNYETSGTLIITNPHNYAELRVSKNAYENMLTYA
jgi:hypothetical protein